MKQIMKRYIDDVEEAMVNKPATSVLHQWKGLTFFKLTDDKKLANASTMLTSCPLAHVPLPIITCSIWDDIRGYGRSYFVVR